MSFLLMLAAASSPALSARVLAEQAQEGKWVQAAGTAASSDILVRGGQTVNRGELRRQASAMSDPHAGQLPRYEDKVCIGMTGLSSSRLEAIVTRFRTIAAAAASICKNPGARRT